MADDKDIDYNAKLKNMQLQFLDKIGGGGLNQNDLMAMMAMMEKNNNPSSMQDMMPMMLMSRMMNPPQKQDSTTPLIMWMMMDGMKRPNGDSDIDKKIEALQRAIEKKEEDSKFKEVLSEIKDMQKNKESIGLKDILTIVANKDQTIETIRGVANEKDREMLLSQFQNSMGALQSEIKNLSSGGDMGKFTETVKAIKTIYSDLGLEKAGQKSKEEVLTGLVSHVADALAPAINHYAANMQRQPQYSPEQGLTPAQAQRFAEIQAKRTVQSANPGSEAPSEPQEEIQRDSFGTPIFPELVDVADSTRKRRA